ncbi:restriction endonuclease subunit S [Chryseobacterium aquaticum]|uniref:restriction endonuclease subunit S n=1 Tax=Chryseobacterium aquaticum TaxID=452084 RepID=UPI001E5928F8|nr:restriction endonuclease subunit S [Chryseobacterium aquaticum]
MFGFPNLRFPGFEGEWEEKILSDLGTFSGGGTPSSSNEKFWNGNIPWISSSDLEEDNIFKINISRFITQDAIEKSSTKLCKAPSVLIVSRVGVGKVALSFNDVCTSQDFTNISELKCNQLYLAFQLSKVMKKAVNEVQGTSIKGISSSEIKSKKIYLPPTIEQEKISSFIEKIDKRIQTQKKIIEQFETLMKVSRENIFSQKLRFKDEQGYDFHNWEKFKLGEIGNFQTSSIDKLSRENENEVYLVNYMNVYRHEDINSTTIKLFQKVTAKEQQITSCNLKKGDILFTPSSETPDDIGHSVVISENLENAVFSYHLMRFRPKIEIDILYSHYFCNIPIVLSQLSKFATGSTRFTISVKSFSDVEVSLPSLPEQKTIGKFLSLIENKIEIEKQILEKLELQKKFLLANLFV